MSKQVNKPQLPHDTQLKLIQIHKETFEEIYTTITYEEWVNYKKDRKYYYRVVQLI